MTESFFSVRDFARFSRTTRDALYHYDKIGLLPPLLRGANKYRYYSTRQLALVNLIRTMRDAGMSLEEIKSLRDRRTPELVESLLRRLKRQVDDKLDDLVRAGKLLSILQKTISSAINVDDGAIAIQFLPQEPIMLGDINDYSRGRSDYDALFSFYASMKIKHPDLDLNYPVWGNLSEERIRRGDWKWPERYYFYSPEGRDARPAGLYAIAYQRGGYGQAGGLYERLIDYIDGNGFEICGDAYEEYPLNEICIADDRNYLVRVMIAVREKN